MDFIALCEKLKPKQCPRWNDRQRRLHALHTVQAYTFYEILKDKFADFDDRYKSSAKQDGEYRPLGERRSGVEYRLASIITRDVIAMLFGEGKFPNILFESEKDTAAAAEIIKTAKLENLMNTAATAGAPGSVVIVPEVFVDGDQNRLFIYVWDSWECEPIFRRLQPDTLEQITRTWLVKRDALIVDGYDVAKLEAKWAKKQNETASIAAALQQQPEKFAEWYIRRRITTTESIWYEPVPKKIYEQKDWDAWEEDRGQIDADGVETPGRSVTHDLGVCYPIWAAPRARPGEIDGPALFDGAIVNQFTIERVASVGAQAMVTAGQPILATATAGSAPSGISDAAALEGTDGYPSTSGSSPRIGPEDVIQVDEKGGAWLVQLDAGALTPLDVLILRLRALSLENAGGSRITEESLSGAKSGYAMELLNQALTYVAGAQRPGWADVLVKLLLMIALMQEKFNGIDGLKLKLSTAAQVKLVSWGPWYEPSGDDLTALVTAALQALEGGAIDHETLVATIAPLFDVVNIDDMVKKTQVEQQQRADQAHQQAIELKTAAPPKSAAAA